MIFLLLNCLPPWDKVTNLLFSKASEQLLNNSLKNTSLSVYILLATMSNNFLVSA